MEGNSSDGDMLSDDVDSIGEESDAEMSTEDVPCVEDEPEYGPHRKLSRGEDLFKFCKEVNLVKEKKFICSLDLFLKLFEGSFKKPNCNKALLVKHHFLTMSQLLITLFYCHRAI